MHLSIKPREIGRVLLSIICFNCNTVFINVPYEHFAGRKIMNLLLFDDPAVLHFNGSICIRRKAGVMGNDQ
jgi:hypothetical protein